MNFPKHLFCISLSRFGVIHPQALGHYLGASPPLQERSPSDGDVSQDDINLDRMSDLDLAKELLHTCTDMYMDQHTGIGPERVKFHHTLGENRKVTTLSSPLLSFSSPIPLHSSFSFLSFGGLFLLVSLSLLFFLRMPPYDSVFRSGIVSNLLRISSARKPLRVFTFSIPSRVNLSSCPPDSLS